MKLLSITASKDALAFVFDVAKSGIWIQELSPVEHAKARQLSLAKLNQSGEIPRYVGAHDRLYSRFIAYDRAAKPIDGVKYVTDIAPGFSGADYAYPQPATKKALHASPEDVKTLGIGQTTYNINLQAIMSVFPSTNTDAFEHDGRTYYFIDSAVKKIDQHLIEMYNQGQLVTLILLNAPLLFDATQESALWDAAIHPAFDFNCPSAYISAFDMRSEEGQGYYRAFVDFLAQRYSRSDAKYGRAPGLIISNEVDSQYVWGNAGEMTAYEYVREYAQAMRQAWLCAMKHYAHMRVYVSLDHYWHNLAHDKTQPLRYYSGRDVIDALADHTARDGDFPWHVAFHPYPENLVHADFWNDRSPDFTFTTPRITFKNMEVLPAYLKQPHMTYRGVPRRIIFSEQGFNSITDDRHSEQNGAAAYVLAYIKARNLPTVDMLFHHAYVDNPKEFGLNLGIRRYDPAQPYRAGQEKPIYYAVKDMDTAHEQIRVAEARAYIGATIFDALINPIVTCADRDTTKDNEFGDVKEQKSARRSE